MFYPPVVKTGAILLLEHHSKQRTHCALDTGGRWNFPQSGAKKTQFTLLDETRGSSCSCFKVPCFRIRCSNVGSFSFSIFRRGISWEEGEIVLQDWVLHTVSECEILHETSNGEFRIQKIDTYMKPASTTFTLEISQHKLWTQV